ncbi:MULTISPECIES: hypothetical protein [unclassified Brevibacterium]|uniref:hypothetical protein n=1 Tax=unclassified Brevibacterium TaxID=2614124 RepID=UPI001E3ACD20|nr:MULTISPECIES: hypothetical protein [unclassified Brevibacterium]MDK8436445.1 hypothetical protein [Brevibacterium sp. H-BE7]
MNLTRFLLGLVIALAGLALISASAGTVNGGFIFGAPTLIIGGLLMSLAPKKRTQK